MYKRIVIVLIIVFSFISCLKESQFDANFKVIAHRGCWKETNSVENSLESLFHAVRFGLNGVELDVCKTIDDSLVVAHGDKHGEYVIAKTDFLTLRGVKLQNREVLPTFAEYLRFYKLFFDSKLELIVEIKHKGEEKQILDVLNEIDLLDDVKFISFGWDICKKVRSLNPFIHISYLNGDKSPQEIANASFNGVAYKMSVYKTNPQWMNEARSLGLTTYVWDVNTESDFIWSADNGVDYIVTDNPLNAMLFKSNYE